MNKLSHHLFLMLVLICSTLTNAKEKCSHLPRSDASIPNISLPKGYALEDIKVSDCKALTTNNVDDGKPLSIQQLEDKRDSMLKSFKPETLYGNLRAATVNFQVDCMIATADIAYCQCVTDRRPWSMSFALYVDVITSASTVSAKSLEMSEDEFRKLIGVTWSTRDICLVNSNAARWRAQ